MAENSNRRARRKSRREGELDTPAFLKIADRFIDLANRQNKTVVATQLQMAFLYAAARYNAFVAKNILHAEDHEEFVETMSGHYKEMLRNHLADPNL